MLRSAVKSIARVVARGGIASMLMRGIGGGIVASIGWKIGSDIYDRLKRRREQSPPAPAPASGDDSPRGGG